MTLQDLMDMPKDKQILIEEILNNDLENEEVVKYCIDKQYIRPSLEDKETMIWDGIKVFQLPIEEMKNIIRMIKHQP